MARERTRCSWCTSDPIYITYHDEEWGTPLRDDRALFELLCLEGQQAGLSWLTVLKKREHYRKLFADFVPEKVARFSDDKIEKILLDPGVVRNRLKIYGIRKNAFAMLALQKELGSFSDFLWQFVGGKTVRGHDADAAPVTATPASDAMSKALKKRGFTFVGTTICYAFMQASGMVDDHMPGCWKRRQR
ncbi:MAG TPA: DNA-3-methyladenine glycosylase I [Permianibacter sp.]|nr:DNA-3-methyladenine glycosylase I [Permianibacter sp.]